MISEFENMLNKKEFTSIKKVLFWLYKMLSSAERVEMLKHHLYDQLHSKHKESSKSRSFHLVLPVTSKPRVSFVDLFLFWIKYKDGHAGTVVSLEMGPWRMKKFISETISFLTGFFTPANTVVA